MQKLSITCTNGGQIVVEGVSYVLVIYLPVCFRIVNPRGKLGAPCCLGACTIIKATREASVQESNHLDSQY